MFQRGKTLYFTKKLPCVKCVQIRSFSGPYFPAFGLNRRDTSHLSVFSPNAGKYGQEKTPYLDTFHAVLLKVNNGDAKCC